MIGQYAHGNEQSQHVAYMYNYAGAPWKTQEMVRRILNEKYTATPEGICGNDDAGQTSSWFVFSALGFYPVNPAQAVYLIGSPLFDEVNIRIGENIFTVKAYHNSPENKYIQSAKLNGKKYAHSWIKHEDIVHGGILEFVMGNEPNRNWGSAQADCPPEGLTPNPLKSEGESLFCVNIR
jgi:predicted alpha-1,2-mannosidase